ncbi:hypothetical protein JCM3774_002218 [Rhodotorula dairenensis]
MARKSAAQGPARAAADPEAPRSASGHSTSFSSLPHHRLLALDRQERPAVVVNEGISETLTTGCPAASTSHTSTLRWGYALVVGSATALVVGLWSILIGPLCEPTGVQLLDALVQDEYYKYLVILLVPVTVCFVIINWWGLKIFRHA